MRAAAQFKGERPTDLDHPDLVGVLLAEERHRSHRFGLLNSSEKGIHRIIGLDGLIGDQLDLTTLIFGECALPVEIEPQISGSIERTSLNRVGAQHLSQCRVNHVRAGVRLGSAMAPTGIGVDDDGVALDELAGFDTDPVHPDGFGDLLHIGHCGLGSSTSDDTDVGDLSAGFGIQRGSVQHDLDPFRWRRFGVHPRVMGRHRYAFAVDENAEDPRL